MAVVKVIFVFLDGIGLAPENEWNPFSQARTPWLRSRLGGRPLIFQEARRGPGFLFKPIDACLGVPGIPQSATGQASLFTGVNAPGFLGHHLPAFPSPSLASMILRESIFKKLKALGAQGTFANAYRPDYFEMVAREKRAHSASTLSVMAAEIPFRWLADLKAGNALCWDITNEFLHSLPEYAPPLVTPETAGERLAAIARSFDFVLFESFKSDLIGHKRNLKAAVELIECIDRFLRAAVESMPGGATLIVTSDHGNLEDLSTGSHTKNPVPFLAVGPLAAEFQAVESIVDVPNRLLELFRQPIRSEDSLERGVPEDGA